MSDAALASMLVHRVNVYHLDVTVSIGLQQTEGYPDRWHPDIADLPCLIVTDGQQLVESVVGVSIGSTALLFCEQADIREVDRVHFGGHVYYVNGTPASYFNPWGAVPNTIHLLVVGLAEHKPTPGSVLT
jgi:hypothetical protein